MLSIEYVKHTLHIRSISIRSSTHRASWAAVHRREHRADCCRVCAGQWRTRTASASLRTGSGRSSRARWWRRRGTSRRRTGAEWAAPEFPLLGSRHRYRHRPMPSPGARCGSAPPHSIAANGMTFDWYNAVKRTSKSASDSILVKCCMQINVLFYSYFTVYYAYFSPFQHFWLFPLR